MTANVPNGATADSADSSEEPYKEALVEANPRNLLTVPREIRDRIYQFTYGYHHIHIEGLDASGRRFNVESMIGLLIEMLRFYFMSADAGYLPRNKPFRYGYLPSNITHRICQRAEGDLPKTDCSGRCCDFNRNHSQLSLVSLRTCHQVYEEARLVPYRFNSFEFSEDNLFEFLRMRSPDQLSEVRRVKIIAGMDRCGTNEALTHWVLGCLKQTTLLKHLTQIILSAKYVSADSEELWVKGYLMTTPRGRSCHVVLGQDEPGEEKYWWITQYYRKDLGLMTEPPIGIQTSSTSYRPRLSICYRCTQVSDMTECLFDPKFQQMNHDIDFKVKNNRYAILRFLLNVCKGWLILVLHSPPSTHHLIVSIHILNPSITRVLQEDQRDCEDTELCTYLTI